MTAYSLDELRSAYEHYSQVADNCAASRDYNALADLFTEDCTYIEHVFGEMRGREAVRQWLVPLMLEWPNHLMTYTHDWVIFDEVNGRVVFCARSHLPDLGDGTDYSATNWTRIDYAGDGLWWREEDIYSAASFGKLLTEWQAAKNAAGT
jgi:ketosteroid isomerase-like protein